MKIEIQHLAGIERETLHRLLVSKHLSKFNFEFAIAAHRCTDLAMMAILHNDAICHAAVIDHDNALHDARGIVTYEQIDKQYELNGKSTVRLTSESELAEVRKLDEFLIEAVSQDMQMLWPKELPWNTSSACRRAELFFSEIGKLCEKHEVIITPSFAATPIEIIDLKKPSMNTAPVEFRYADQSTEEKAGLFQRKLAALSQLHQMHLRVPNSIGHIIVNSLKPSTGLRMTETLGNRRIVEPFETIEA